MLLSGLFIYPIKGCAGLSLAESALAPRGLAFDRRFMLVDRRGVFITQRELSKLCLVRTELREKTLAVAAPGMPELLLPLEPESGEAHPYQLWGHTGSGWREPDGSRWFSELLRDEIHLVFMPDSERRPVNPKRARPGDIVSFADGYPLLAISEASLADLNRRLAEPVTMSRFRPSLVIAGAEPYAEDGFRRVRIGGVTLRGVKRCERCVVTTIDPATGARGPEPLRTLAQYRREEGKIWFGMNLIHDGLGVLRVGAAVVVES